MTELFIILFIVPTCLYVTVSRYAATIIEGKKNGAKIFMYFMILFYGFIKV